MSSFVLIADGNPEDYQLVRDRLSEAASTDGLHLRFGKCGEGEAGLIVYYSGTPDCILVDHHLPNMGGLEFLKRLKGGTQGISVPVVLLTGSGDVSSSTDALRAGAQECLCKRSLGPEILFCAVQSAQNRIRLFGH